MTDKQRERQRHRERSSGRYANVNPCYACNKSAGVDYCSHRLTDCVGSDGEAWGDAALVLCEECAEATRDMTSVIEFYAYRRALRVRR